MRPLRPSSEKEQRQLALCQRLIIHKSYHSQEELRRDMQRHGFAEISQSTVSRLLKLLGIIKIVNAKGQKIYALNPIEQPQPNTVHSVAEMVRSVEHNNIFIMIHTVVGYGPAVAKILDHHAIPEILGVVSGNNVVWVAPREIYQTPQVRYRIAQALGLN